MINPLPKISVVIPHYNSGAYFQQAYDSLVQQTESNWEAVIVDDASTDGSLELVKSFIDGDERFVLYENEVNQGAASAFQTAIEKSQADIFLRLDPDDALAPQALETMLNAHAEHPNVGLIYSNHYVCDEFLNVKHVHECRQITHITTEESFLYHCEIAQLASFKREFFEKTDGVHTFNKRAEDVDMYLKMCEVAPVVYIPENLYYYRIHPGSRRQFENKERAGFWYWVAAIKMAERRKLNIEDFFVKHCARRSELEVYLQREARIKRFINSNILFRSAFKAGARMRLFDPEKILNP